MEIYPKDILLLRRRLENTARDVVRLKEKERLIVAVLHELQFQPASFVSAVIMYKELVETSGCQGGVAGSSCLMYTGTLRKKC